MTSHCDSKLLERTKTLNSLILYVGIHIQQTMTLRKGSREGRF